MANEELFRNIILTQNVNELLALSDDEMSDFMITLMYDFFHSKPLNEMNTVQKTLYLAMFLEDTCQADSLPSLSEDEEIFLSLHEMKDALETLGAVKTAEYLGSFIDLLPENTVPEWEWFFEPERSDIIEQLDGAICEYPDGSMTALYISYTRSDKNAEALLTDLA